VLFLRTEDEPNAIGRAWERLEATTGLRGRKFFGAFYPATGEYRACVQAQEGDDPAALGLQSGRLPGGPLPQDAAPRRAAAGVRAHRHVLREIDLLLPIATT
jgi:hypothetical protein